MMFMSQPHSAATTQQASSTSSGAQSVRNLKHKMSFPVHPFLQVGSEQQLQFPGVKDQSHQQSDSSSKKPQSLTYSASFMKSLAKPDLLHEQPQSLGQQNSLAAFNSRKKSGVNALSISAKSIPIQPLISPQSSSNGSTAAAMMMMASTTTAKLSSDTKMNTFYFPNTKTSVIQNKISKRINHVTNQQSQPQQQQPLLPQPPLLSDNQKKLSSGISHFDFVHRRDSSPKFNALLASKNSSESLLVRKPPTSSMQSQSPPSHKIHQKHYLDLQSTFSDISTQADSSKLLAELRRLQKISSEQQEKIDNLEKISMEQQNIIKEKDFKIALQSSSTAAALQESGQSQSQRGPIPSKSHLQQQVLPQSVVRDQFHSPYPLQHPGQQRPSSQNNSFTTKDLSNFNSQAKLTKSNFLQKGSQRNERTTVNAHALSQQHSHSVRETSPKSPKQKNHKILSMDLPQAQARAMYQKHVAQLALEKNVQSDSEMTLRNKVNSIDYANQPQILEQQFKLLLERMKRILATKRVM